MELSLQPVEMPRRAVAELMQDMPLGKIRNFGGKLGAELQALGCTTAGQVGLLSINIIIPIRMSLTISILWQSNLVKLPRFFDLLID